MTIGGAPGAEWSVAGRVWVFLGTVFVVGFAAMGAMGLAGPVEAAGMEEAVPEEVAAVRVVGFSEVLAMALADNHSLKASRARMEAAQEGSGEALSHLLPQIRLEERYLRTDNPAYVFSTKINQGRFLPEDLAGAPETFNHPDTLDDFQTTVSLQQPLFAPGAVAATRMADAGARAAGFMHERAREETALHVFEAYEQVRAAKAFKGAAESSLADAEEHVRIARARRDAGIGLDSDVLQLEAALDGARAELVRAESGVALATRGLGLVAGASGPLDIREDDLVELPLVADSGRLSTRADVQAMEEDVNRAASGVRMAEGNFYPSLGVFAAGQWNDPDNPFGSSGDSFQAGAVLRWDLFSGFGDRSRRARALKELEAAREAEQEFVASARFALEEARLHVKEAAATKKLAARSLEATREGMRLVALRYENGLAPVVSLMSAQATLDGARARQIAAETRYAIALGALHFQRGTLLEHLLVSSEASSGETAQPAGN